jgi:hypothetical protein
MTRQIILAGQHEDVHLREVLADNEAQLQTKLQEHPELLPIEEFGLDGPLMVVGCETTLPSGSADLVGMAPGGDVVIVEFKTGPQNSDFRHSLAQLFDYGAALWEMEPDEFESAVVRRYLDSDRCPPDAPTKGALSVAEAARRTWSGRSDEDVELFTQRWQRCLKTGAFHYVVAAQRFTATMERTIQHLNDQARSARIYAVEIVRFSGGSWEAFEGRTVVKPVTLRSDSARGQTDEDELLERIPDETHRQAVGQLLEFARGQRLVLEWGSVGVSIRLRVPEVNEPLSIAWLYPPGVGGWIGLRDLTLGYDRGQAKSRFGEVEPQPLIDYLNAVGKLPLAEAVESPHVNGYRLPPRGLVDNATQVTEAIAALVEDIASRG